MDYLVTSHGHVCTAWEGISGGEDLEGTSYGQESVVEMVQPRGRGDKVQLRTKRHQRTNHVL